MSEKLEFGGVPGNLAMVVGLPVFTAYLYFAVAFNGGALLPGAESDWSGFLGALEPSALAAAAYLAWFAFQAALQAWAPGPVVKGTELPDGRRLGYKMNGPAAVVATALVVGGGQLLGWWSLTAIHDHFGGLLVAMTVFTYLFAIFLYWYGKRHGEFRGSGNPIHDFWMGTGHNPRIPPGGLFDLKFFCEARPGLILWVIINLSFAMVQYREYGFVSLSMILVNVFQAMYVLE